MPSGISVKLPLTVSPRDGTFTLNQNLKQSVAQNLKTLLYTAPGERIMDLNFGVGLRRYLFEPLTEVVKDKLQNRILKQITTYMPFVRVIAIEMIAAADSSMLGIKLQYSAPGSRRQILKLIAR
jgi:phage baseplate assembly protein W